MLQLYLAICEHTRARARTHTHTHTHTHMHSHMHHTQIDSVLNANSYLASYTHLTGIWSNAVVATKQILFAFESTACVQDWYSFSTTHHMGVCMACVFHCLML